MRVRAGTFEDFDAVLTLGDEAVAWMKSRGGGARWAVEPWTGIEQGRRLVHDGLLGDGAYVAVTDADAVVGFLLASERAAAADERELHIDLLLSSRRYRGRGVGALLVEQAKLVAAERDIDLIRVDCWAGADDGLVSVYEGYGFRRVRELSEEGRPGLLLAMRLSGQ